MALRRVQQGDLKTMTEKRQAVSQVNDEVLWQGKKRLDHQREAREEKELGDVELKAYKMKTMAEGKQNCSVTELGNCPEVYSTMERELQSEVLNWKQLWLRGLPQWFRW